MVENFELNPQPLPPAPASSARPPAAPVEGHWVSVGRLAQQNWILKVQGSDVWGLVCGPCTPAVVTMIDGRIDGDTILFYINHIDTPPSPTRKGIQRNVMTGTITGGDNGNVMKFKWVERRLRRHGRDHDDRPGSGSRHLVHALPCPLRGAATRHAISNLDRMFFESAQASTTASASTPP